MKDLPTRQFELPGWDAEHRRQEEARQRLLTSLGGPIDLEAEERRQGLAWRRHDRLLAVHGRPDVLSVRERHERQGGDGLVDFERVVFWLIDENPGLDRGALLQRFRRCVARGDFGFRDYGPRRRVVRDLIDLGSWNSRAVLPACYSLRPLSIVATATPLSMWARRSTWGSWAGAQGWILPPELKGAPVIDATAVAEPVSALPTSRKAKPAPKKEKIEWWFDLLPDSKRRHTPNQLANMFVDETHACSLRYAAEAFKKLKKRPNQTR